MAVKIAIGHARVSKGDAEEIKNSLESQKSEIINFAEKRLKIKEENILWCIEEEARSSYSERADWAKFEEYIKTACSNPDIKYFISYSQERFCRNSNFSKIYKDRLRKKNVKVRFVSGDIENPESVEGFMQEQMGETFAQVYSMKVSNDTLRGCKENAKTRDKETGYVFKNGGSAPFWLKKKKVVIGQDKSGEDIKKVIWVENDTTYTAKLNGKIVSRTMWDWARYYFIELRLNQKLGIEKARDILNELGIPAPRKKYWATTCLYEAEKNEALLGISIYNKRKFAQGYNGQIKDKEEWIIEENAHPALLTKEEFEGLQILRKNKLKRSGAITKFQSNNEHLLIGNPEKFTCASCGHKIISSGNVYTCGTYNTHGKKGCGASYFSVNCEWLENKILDEIMKNFLDKAIEKTYKDFVKEYKIDDKKQSNIKNLKKAINNKESAQSNLIQSLSLMSSNNSSVINIITQELEKISNELEELQAELAKQSEEKVIKIPTFESYKKALLKSKMLLIRSNTAENKNLIWNFVNSIKLDPTERQVIVEFNSNPFGFLFSNGKTPNNKIEGANAPSMKLVAGAGFEPTTFGL